MGPPTDEELAGIKADAQDRDGGGATGHDVLLLIAEVERLRVEVDYYKPIAQIFLERLPELGKAVIENGELRSEVERLKADNAEWERLHDHAERLCARCGRELEQQRMKCPPCAKGEHYDCQLTRIGLLRAMCGCECRES